MQTSIDFFQEAARPSLEISSDPNADVKHMLENYIAVCGLVAFKDFFMKIKNDQIENIPDGITKMQYLDLAREVYQSRAGRIERQKGRAKFFAIKNRNKK